MKVAVFDSGLGGLSVLHRAFQMLPEENFIYFADRDHVPYGTKSKEEILSYVESAIDFMIAEGADAIVLACNTATSAAAKEMREKYSLPIIGMEPAVKKAVDADYGKRILVIATPMTVKGKKLQELIERVDREHLVDAVALPKLVSFAEEQVFVGKEVEEYLRESFASLDLEAYSCIVLGCTHFNYYKDSLAKLFPKGIHFLDGNEGTVRKLKSELEKLSRTKREARKEVEYFYSRRKVESFEEKRKLKNYLERLDAMLEIE